MTTPPAAIAIDTITAAAVKTCAERRARVLAHPDLAAALTKPPLSYSRPEVWNGYVPPALDSNGRRNESTRRAALIELLNAVAEREEGPF